MSLKTWKEEFYSTEANKVKRGDALDHSIQKWIGLRPKNIKKHGLYLECADLMDDDNIFGINADSCALCQRYLKPRKDNSCATCPLFKFLGRRCDDGEDSPYMIFDYTNNPEPMIKALKGAKNRTKTKKL